MNRMSLLEFRKSGLFWVVNRMLHIFGVVLVMEISNDGKIIEMYPAKCKCRGFKSEDEIIGFKKITKFMKNNIKRLEKEVK